FSSGYAARRAERLRLSVDWHSSSFWRLHRRAPDFNRVTWTLDLFQRLPRPPCAKALPFRGSATAALSPNPFNGFSSASIHTDISRTSPRRCPLRGPFTTMLIDRYPLLGPR